MSRRLKGLSYAVAAWVSALVAFEVLWQGKTEILLGQLGVVVATLAMLWFGLRAWLAGGRIATAIAGAGLAYVATVGGLFLCQEKFLFLPVPGRFGDCPAAISAGFTSFEAGTGSDRVRALVRRRPGARGWLILFHGNGETTCDGIALYSAALTSLPIDLALAEYPGYAGDTLAASSESAFTTNSIAAFDRLVALEPSSIPAFVMGRSLGTGVATYLASRRAVAGLVLISPYTSVADAAAYQFPFFPARALLKNTFPAETWAQAVHAPAFVVHGDHDRVIPISIGRRLREKLPALAGSLEIPGAGHDDIVVDDRLWQGVRRFITARLAP
jgi:pimeloyl-ACP methyl ester carboxylesterase